MAISILIVPAYLHLLGLAGIGLIAFYTAVYGITAVIDQTLSTVLIREASRDRNLHHDPQFTRDLLRTLEGITLAAGSIIFAIAFFFHTKVAQIFLNTSPVEPNMLARCVVMMGAAIAIQLLLGLQANMASALERADLSNALTLAATLLRAFVSIAALLSLERSVEVYFAAQLAALVLTLIASTWLVWRAMPSGETARPRLALLSKAIHYMPALFGSALLFVAITQVDKLVVAKMLTVTDLGRYYLASTVASMIWAPLGPIHLTLMPRLSALIAKHEEGAVRRLLHLSSQFLTAAIVPAAVLVVLFAEPVLFLWTAQPDVAREAAPILSILAAGTAFWALAGVPNTLQFAAGTARFSFITGLAGVALLPFGALASLSFGAAGPALVLIGAAAVQIVILPTGIFRRLKIDTSVTWYVKDVAIPLAAATATGFVLRQFPVNASNRVTVAIELLAYFLTLTISVVVVSAELRRAAAPYLRTLFRQHPAT